MKIWIFSLEYIYFFTVIFFKQSGSEVGEREAGQDRERSVSRDLNLGRAMAPHYFFLLFKVGKLIN